MNVVKPTGIETDSDRILSLLILAKAFGKVLQENEGVAIIPENDMLKFLPNNVKCLIVSRYLGQIRILHSEEIYPDGQRIWMHGIDRIIN